MEGRGMLRPYQHFHRLAQFSLMSFWKWSLGQSNAKPGFLRASR